MKRSAVHLAALVTAVLASSAWAADTTPTPVAYASIAQLQERMDAGTLDSRQLTQQMLERIDRALLDCDLFVSNCHTKRQGDHRDK